MSREEVNVTTRVRNALLALTAATAVAYLVQPPETPGSYVVWWSCAIGCTVAIALALYRFPGWAQRAWIWLGIGIALLAAGDLVYDLTGMGAISLPDSPPTSQVLYVAGMTAMAFGLMGLASARSLRRESTAALDATIIFVSFGTSMFMLIIEPTLRTWSGSKVGLAIAVAEPAIDVVLAALATRLWLITDRQLDRSVRILVLGVAAYLAADMHYLRQAIDAPDGPPGWPLVLYLISYGLIAASAWDPRRRDSPFSGDRKPSVEQGRTLVVLVLSLALPTVSHEESESELGSPLASPLAGATVVLSILIGARFYILLRDYRRSVDRERTLRELTAAIAAAESLPSDHQLSAWIQELTADKSAGLLGPEGKTTAAVQFEMGSPADGLPIWTIVAAREPDGPTMGALETLRGNLSQARERSELAERVVSQRSEMRLQTLLENTSDVVLLLDLDGFVLYATPAVVSLTGLNVEDVVGRAWTDLMAEPDRKSAHALLARTAYDGTSRGEIGIPHAEGSTRITDVTVTTADQDGEQLFVITHHDSTERHQLQNQLIAQAFHDPLTGLPNRALFRDRLSQALMRAKRSGTDFLVMLIDLDDFKMVNDSLGHPAGDLLLRTVARRLESSLRHGDTAARLGGDEFAVILENTASVKDGEKVAQRILAEIQSPIMLGATQVRSHASIGLAAGDASHRDSDELERNADLALYQAKGAGKDCYALYQSGMHDEAVRRLSLHSELRQAVERHEFEAWFQPILTLDNGSLVGLESLARWHHPRLGVLPPSAFIGAAEETGLINALGRSILERSLTLAGSWINRYPNHANLRLTVNVSGRQLLAGDFVEFIANALAESTLRPDRLILEITESVLLPGEGIPVDRLQSLADLGIAIYIDDFGTGWSSLRYLRTLPVRGIKLAQEFVTGLPLPDEVGLVRAIRDLADTLGLDEVIAEGVENDAQRRSLLALGYRIAQGYLLAEPMAPRDAEEMLRLTPAGIWSPVSIPWPSQPTSIDTPALLRD